MNPNSNDQFDALIRVALSREEADLFDQLGEPTVPEAFLGLFTGSSRRLVWITTVVILVFFAGSIYCAVQFYQAPTIREMMLWGAGLFFCILAVLANKIWNWMEMNRQMLMREVKRLELQVAHLSHKLEEQENDEDETSEEALETKP